MQRFLQTHCQGSNYCKMKKFLTGESKTMIIASFLIGGMLAGCSKAVDVNRRL